jgi:hypothetical protein
MLDFAQNINYKFNNSHSGDSRNSPANSQRIGYSKQKKLILNILIIIWLMTGWVQTIIWPANLLLENFIGIKYYNYNLETGPFVSVAGVVGPVSGVTYTLDSINNGAKYGVLKRNLDKTQDWAIYVSGVTFGNRWMAIKSDESSLFAISRSAAIYLFEFSGSDGSIIRALDHSANYDTNFDFPDVVLSSDDADIYFTANKIVGSEKAICKLVLSGTSFDCYYISSIIQIDPITRIIANDFFISGFTNTSPNNLFVMRLTYGSTTPVWKKEADCLFGSWTYNLGASVMSTDGTKIYFMTTFGSTIVGSNNQLYFLVINASDGSLARAINKPGYIWYRPVVGLVADDLYVRGAIGRDSPDLIFAYKINNGQFFMSSGYYRFNDIGRASGITQLFGRYTNENAITFSYISYISYSWFNQAGVSSTALDELGHTYADSSLTISSDSSSLFNGFSGFTNSSLVYSQQGYWPETYVVNNINEETIYIPAGMAFTVTPNVSCSYNGQSIIYSLLAYGGVPVPEWIVIDSSTGEVSGTSPWDVNDTQYKMYVVNTSPEVNQNLLIVSINDNSAWNSEVTDWAKFATHSAQVLTILGISMSLGIFALSGAYLSGIWTIVEQIQLIILVISKEVFIPVDVDYYLKGNIELLFNFASIPVLEVPFFAEVSEWLDLEQNVSAASELELESRSTLKNHFTMIMIILLVSLCYLITKLTHNCSGNRLSSFFGKFRAKILFFIGFVFYVRILLEGFLSLTLSSVAEIYQFKGESYQEIASFALSIAFLLIWVALLLVSIFYSCKFRNQTLPSKFRFMELFTGLRKSKWAHFYTPFSLSRRFLFVLIIVLSNNDNRESIFAPLILIQIIFWMYVIVIRPFETTGDNILQIQIEAFITIAIVYFYPFSSEEKWSQTATDAFLGIIFANSWLICIILFSKQFDSNRNSPRNCYNYQKLKKKTSESFNWTQTTRSNYFRFIWNNFIPNFNSCLFKISIFFWV